MFFIVYVTTNILNGKIYVGKHTCRSLLDGYLGSGKLLRAAIKKYGLAYFDRRVLLVCNDMAHMNSVEREIVTANFCLRDDTYNLCVGGEGGFDYINTTGIKKFHGRTHTAKARATISDRLKGNTFNKGKSSSDSTRQKLRDIAIERGFGTVIRGSATEHSRRKISDTLKDGYASGRIKKQCPGINRRGKPLSELERQALSEAGKRSWASGVRPRPIRDWSAIQEDINAKTSRSEIFSKHTITKNVFDYGLRTGCISTVRQKK